MPTATLIDLIEILCRPAARYRAGVWLVPDNRLNKEVDIVADLPRRCDVIDLRLAVLSRHKPSDQLAGIELTSIYDWIEDILEKEVVTDCVVLLHLDLLLARLKKMEREEVWNYFLTGYVRRKKSIVFAFPNRAVGKLIEEQTRNLWAEKQRLTHYEPK